MILYSLIIMKHEARRMWKKIGSVLTSRHSRAGSAKNPTASTGLGSKLVHLEYKASLPMGHIYTL